MLTIKSCLPFPGCTEGKSLWQWLHSTWPGFCLDYISLKYFLAFQASPVLQPHEELDLVASSPQGLSLGPSPRNSYPLVDLRDLTLALKDDYRSDMLEESHNSLSLLNESFCRLWWPLELTLVKMLRT